MNVSTCVGFLANCRARVFVEEHIDRDDTQEIARANSLRHIHELKHVTVQVLEIMPRPPLQSLSLLSSRLQGALPYASPAFLDGSNRALRKL